MLYDIREGFTNPSDLEAFNYAVRAGLNIFKDDVHPLFQKWLISEPANSFNEVLDDIAVLLGYFEYGKIHHFLRHVSIECDQSLSTMILRNYSDQYLNSVNGHCGEVNDKAYLLIRHKYPTINMLKVQGQRGGFGSGWNHWFLLISKHPFSCEGKIAFTPDTIYFDCTRMELPNTGPLDTESREPQIADGILIGDASAGTVTELDLSSYVLTPPVRSCTSINRLSDDPASLQVCIERKFGNYAMAILGRSKLTMTLLSIGLHEKIPAPVIGVEEFIREQINNDGRRYKPAEYFAYDDQQLVDKLQQLSPDLVEPVVNLQERFVW